MNISLDLCVKFISHQIIAFCIPTIIIFINFFTYYNVNGLGMARRYWKIPSSSFGVGQYPPRPSASPPDIGEGIAQPLRIQRVFSNTSSPCLGHCHISGQISSKNTLALNKKMLKMTKVYSHCAQ